MHEPCCAGSLAALALAGCLVATPAAPAATSIDGEHWFGSLQWRCIGPSRGGRCVAVAGARGDRTTFYMGGTGGGVWKTTSGGATWQNVSDGFFHTGSVGAIAVADSDPNVVYVGMGEACVRGNFSHGDGVYKSLDAGRTWTHVGLGDSRQIGAVVVHPGDADLVFVAALGHVFGPSAQRGVFRSRDGGANWEQVLSAGERSGAVDLAMDPLNPRVLFAAFWQVQRTPWSLESGGKGSGLYRSTDGGETWTELTDGLPRGIEGRIGVSVSAARAGRVWALVEAEDGGVFRSDDGGETWTRVNQERKLRQRAWYYTHIYADPQEAETVYVLNVRFHKSIDGGRTYTTIRVPHGDNHDLWIDPDDHRRMINGNDGGANVSYDGGRTWSRQDNQPTAQFYHVATDTGFPYRVYGAQQDNSTVSISSRNRLGGRDEFYPVGGGESGYIAPRPDDPNIVYAGSYGGYLTRYDHRLRLQRNIAVWPENPMGAGAADLVHRFQWTFPIVISPHDPNVLYAGGEMLFKSADEGETWTAISPDLTTNDKTRQAASGGPITHDNTSVEYYCTIFSVAESPRQAGLIWAGSDDGLVHVTGDGGASWADVTPPGMGDWPMISMIEASPHDADTAYLAVNRYKMDDFRPFVYRTTDRGATWTRCAEGIDDHAFVRSVREDPRRPGLLYAATETGVWVSFDRGERWQSLQGKLPVVPVTDLRVQGDELVISTQGRSFWILQGLSVLRQLQAGGARGSVAAATETSEAPPAGRLDAGAAKLFAPAPAYRKRWDAVRVHFNLPAALEGPARIEFLQGDGEGEPIRAYPLRLRGDEEETAGGEDQDRGEGGDEPADKPVTVTPGMNLFRWNQRGPDPVKVPGAVGWPSPPPGPRVAPGRYLVRLSIGDRRLEAPFEVRPDPRVETTDEGYRAQVALLAEIHQALSRAHRAVNTIRALRRQVDAAVERAKTAGREEKIAAAARDLETELSAVENAVIQTRSKAPQDPLNYPVMLNDKLAALAYAVDGDYAPTAQARAVFKRLTAHLEEQDAHLSNIIDERVRQFNELVEQEHVPAVVVEPR